FMPDGKHLISCSALRLHRWDLTTGASTFSLGETTRVYTSTWYSVTADAKQVYMFISHDADGVWGWRCLKYDLETGQELAHYTPKFQPDNRDDDRSVPSWLSPDGKVLASFTYHDGLIVLRRVEDGSFIRSIRPSRVKTDVGSGLEPSLAFAPDGR